MTSTSRRPAAWLRVAVLVAPALPVVAAQPQPWTPYSFEGQWGGGGGDGIVATGSARTGAAFRSVDFAEATCRQLGAALPLSFSIPVSFAIRSAAPERPRGECWWGTASDLDHVLRDPQQADPTALKDGVFRSRLTPDLGYDLERKQFTFGVGATRESWRRKAERELGAQLQLTEEQRGGFAVLRLVADATKGAVRVYRLYLGGVVEGGVLLINYYPSTRGRAVDEATWARFVEGIQRARATATPRS